MRRDYDAEINAIIDAVTSHGPYNSRVAAAEVVAKLRATDPELLAEWLDVQAEEIVHQAINSRDRSARSIARAHAGRVRFRTAAVAAKAGDMEPLQRLLDMKFVVARSGDRKSLGEMNGRECGFVAAKYERSARRSQMHGALMRALEKKIGDDRVEDHFTEEQLGVLWRSFVTEST